MSENRELTQRPRRRGPMGRGMQPGEKPKDLKKSVKKLMQYIAKYKIGIFVVMLFAAFSTIFNVAGPKILGKATTALSEGLMKKIQGTGSIDFHKIGLILLIVLALYLASALFSFVQGWIMTGITTVSTMAKKTKNHRAMSSLRSTTAAVWIRCIRISRKRDCSRS